VDIYRTGWATNRSRPEDRGGAVAIASPYLTPARLDALVRVSRREQVARDKYVDATLVGLSE